MAGLRACLFLCSPPLVFFQVSACRINRGRRGSPSALTLPQGSRRARSVLTIDPPSSICQRSAPASTEREDRAEGGTRVALRIDVPVGLGIHEGELTEASCGGWRKNSCGRWMWTSCG